MAGITDLGGLFFQLGLLPDKHSFETGYRLIDGTVNKFTMLIGTARNAANVLQSMAVEAGKTDSALYKTSTKLGVTAEVLGTWQAAAKIAGISVEGLISSIGDLDYAFNNYTLDGIDKYLKKLGLLGFEIKELMDENGEFISGDKALTKILDFTITKYNNAESENEKKKIGYALAESMGDSVYGLFVELLRTGMSPEAYLANAKSTQFQSNESVAKGTEFITEWNQFKTSLESISNLFGDEIGGALTEQMKNVNEWLRNNGDEIKKAVETIAKVVGVIAAKIGAYSGDLLEMLIATINGDWDKAGNAGNDLGAQIVSDITGTSKENLLNRQEAYKRLMAYRTEHGWDINEQMPYSRLTPELKELFDTYGPQKPNVGKNYQWAGVIKDGIVRPDGTITQVAPDDWVIAARNLGDLARAFIPQGMTQVNAGGGEYIINQTFNISGTSDMPQVLRQQAYNGTQDAMMQMMQQSSQRLQLMSGTR